MPGSCEELTEEYELLQEELALIEEGCDQMREALAAEYREAIAAVEALEASQEALETEAEELIADSVALEGDGLPEHDDCAEQEQAWTQAYEALGVANAAWNALIFDYQAAWEAYETALEDYDEIHDHLTAAQEHLDLVLAQIAELEGGLGDDESSSELEDLRELEAQLQEDVADLTEADAAAFAVVEATDAASAAYLDDLETADNAAIEAEINEQAAWDAWQACLETQQDHALLEEMRQRLEEIGTELEQVNAQLEVAKEERDLLQPVTGQTWTDSMAECFRNTDAATEDITEVLRKMTNHGC